MMMMMTTTDVSHVMSEHFVSHLWRHTILDAYYFLHPPPGHSPILCDEGEGHTGSGGEDTICHCCSGLSIPHHQTRSSTTHSTAAAATAAGCWSTEPSEIHTRGRAQSKGEAAVARCRCCDCSPDSRCRRWQRKRTQRWVTPHRGEGAGTAQGLRNGSRASQRPGEVPGQVTSLVIGLVTGQMLVVLILLKRGKDSVGGSRTALVAWLTPSVCVCVGWGGTRPAEAFTDFVSRLGDIL